MMDSFRQDMRGELERLKAAPEFARAPVLSRLLDFLVSESLAGRGGRLKAYQIAVDALGRGPDFDPQSDSYPRVQAGRLRKALDAFYAENGPADQAHPVRLSMPMGSYAIELIELASPDNAPCAAAGSPAPEVAVPEAPAYRAFPGLAREPLGWAMMIAMAILGAGLIWAIGGGSRAGVATMADGSPDAGYPMISIRIGEGQSDPDIANTFAYRLEMGLQRFGKLRVARSEPGLSDDAAGPSPEYELTIEPAPLDEERSLGLVLRQGPDKVAIWTAMVPVDAPDLQHRIDALASEIGRSNGEIAMHQLQGRMDDFSPGYACLLHADEYRRVGEPRLGEKVLRCIQRSLDLFPRDPEVLATASLIEIMRDKPVSPEQLETSASYARRALDYGKGLASANIAVARTAMFEDQCKRVAIYGDRALETNPLEPAYLSDYAGMMLSCGELERAEALYSESMELDRDATDAHWAGLIFIHTLRGDDAGALSLVEQSGADIANHAPLTLLAATVAYARSADLAKAEQYWRKLHHVLDLEPTVDPQQVILVAVTSKATARRVETELRRTGLALTWRETPPRSAHTAQPGARPLG